MRPEDELLRRLRRRHPRGGGLRVGIGDDATVIAAAPGRDLVVTTDLLVENVHFRRRAHSPHSVGWKALARSLSDLAAMGARPRYALAALALPPAMPARWVDEFFRGFGALARRHGVRLAGGDLSRARQIVADVQAIGDVPRGSARLRSGARPGDQIFVSGTLGLAALGLRGLRKSRQAGTARRACLYPEPRVRLGQRLAQRGATAMIDLSDGLSTDLARLCEASRAGARLDAVRIPTPAAAGALELALHGGEDYELLFTMPRAAATRLPRRLAGVRLTRIGEIVRGHGISLVDSRGHVRSLRPAGWDHFRRA